MRFGQILYSEENLGKPGFLVRIIESNGLADGFIASFEELAGVFE